MIAIHAENLGKEFWIGGNRERYKTLRDSLTDMISAPIRRARGMVAGQSGGVAGSAERFWALQNVSFEIQQGEIVGIIGRNGAGKSTLLKVLSRITEPSSGYADVYGRVGSLLEVGTGFHPELTGRENLFLNGAILGMKRKEIARKFDEIVAFAEVEKFMDTPVKHYSSGMYLRLAFSVAAHLEPEILLVDEVLAVGDAAFQKKCLGKMGEVADGGRTVLFVSHNLTAVRNLCSRVIMLDKGQLVLNGPTNDVLKAYANEGFSLQTNIEFEEDNAPGSLMGRILSVRLLPIDTIGITTGFSLEIDYLVTTPTMVTAQVLLYTMDNVCVFSTGNMEEAALQVTPGKYHTRVTIPPFTLNEGRYFLNVVLLRNKGETIAKVVNALEFEVTDDDSDPWRQGITRQLPGILRPRFAWRTERLTSAGENK